MDEWMDSQIERRIRRMDGSVEGRVNTAGSLNDHSPLHCPQGLAPLGPCPFSFISFKCTMLFPNLELKSPILCSHSSDLRVKDISFLVSFFQLY